MGPKNSQKTPAPDAEEALDELGDAIDEMENDVSCRAREMLCEMSPKLKIGLGIGAVALGAGAVILALKRQKTHGGPEQDEEDTTPSSDSMGPKVKEAIATAAGKAIEAGFAALARRASDTDRQQ